MKFFHFFLWLITATLVLPCVFVAAIIYPKWEKWGESF